MRLLVPGGLLVALALSAGPARAEPTAADKETARRMMADGREHRDKGDLQGALASFRAADAIMQVPTTGIEVASTEVALGQLVEALDKLLTVARSSKTPNEPKPFAEARASAQVMSQAVVARIPSIKIVVHGLPPNAAPDVTVDGVAIPAATLVAPRAVNPGHHVITASVGSGKKAVTESDVPEGATKEIAIELPAASLEAARTPPEGDHSSEPPPGRHVSPLTYAAFGVGIAGVVAGGVTGALAISSFNSAKSKGCVDNRCPPGTDGDLDTASTMATVSTIAFIAGGAGIALGVVALLVGHKSSASSDAPEHASVIPWLGPGSAGLRGTF